LASLKGEFIRSTSNRFRFFDFQTMMALSTLSTMAGKFILGAPTDYFGGELTLKATMFSMAGLLYLCSLSNSLVDFGSLWILISFVYATAWGACGKIVRDKFPVSNWSSQLGMISGLSRIGSMFASVWFSTLLRPSKITAISNTLTTTGLWRKVFRCGAALQIIVLAIYVVIDKVFLSGTLSSAS
jgi:MFS family permease